MSSVPFIACVDRGPIRHPSLAGRVGCSLLLVAMLLVGTTGGGVAVADDRGASGSGSFGAGASWSGTQPAARPLVRYAAPVRGAVRRGFEPPTTARGAGHRGVDLEATGGQVIRAAADGTVRHAGSVAGTVWVSVAHADGVTTSYGPLTSLQVRPGTTVTLGTELGRLAAAGHGHDGADRGLHWGARRGRTYLDPRSLLRDVGRPSLVGPGGWRGTDHAVRAYEPYPGGRAWAPASPVADRPGYAVAPNPNHVVMIPGLASSSSSRVIDADHLGYDPRSVTAWSYAERRPVAADPDDPRRDHAPYGPHDTWAGVDVAARRLADQLRAQQAREPGRAVDLIGHSMGGIVALVYLLEHHDPYDPTLPQLGHVVTIGSPLQGSDLAALARALDDHPLLGVIASQQRDVYERGQGGALADLPLDAPAIDQLGPGSTMLDRLARGWSDAHADGGSGPLATGTRVLTIAGSRDRVVGAYAARTPDAGVADVASTHRVLPGSHSGVLDTEAVRETVWRFLADEPLARSDGVVAQQVSREYGALLRLLSQLLRSHDPASMAEEARRVGPP